MNPPEPPALATWLMSKLAGGENRESMIGDLIEQHRRGRSSGWYWRQALAAIIVGTASEISRHALTVVAIAALGASLPEIYMRSGLGMRVAQIDQLWYPHVIHTRWSWMVVNPWAYRLQPYWLTFRVAWCGLLALISWIVSRVRSRQRGLLLTVFLLPQFAFALPYLRMTFGDWLREPDNPIWFFNFFWYALFTLIAIPSSILLGSQGGSTADP